MKKYFVIGISTFIIEIASTFYITSVADKNYSGIRGILKKDGLQWKVIDGYHRLSKTENKMVKVLIIE